MGVAAADLEFSSWGWAFRSQEIRDYGIDAHVEPFDGPHRPTGSLAALQIKSGPSYFREKATDGWWYRGTKKNLRHLPYWLNHVLPVLIVIYDPRSRTLYWQHVTEERVVYTDTAWKILIPHEQILSSGTIGRLRAIADSAPGAREDPAARSLSLLPPSAVAMLRQAERAEPVGMLRLARLLAEGREQSRLTSETILAARPSWLPGTGGMFEAAIGAYANEHGHSDLAIAAFTRAAEYGSEDAGRLYAVAALLALGRADTRLARELLRRPECLVSDGLFLSVARAALADHEHNDVDSLQVAAVLSGASREDLDAEPVLLAMLGGLAGRRGDLAEAIRLFEAAAAGYPPLAAARLELAHALIARSASGSSIVAVTDRLRAQSLAREVQNEVRQWSGPSERALATLLKAHMTIGAFQEIVRLATPESLAGAALDREASFGEVAVWGAEAALAMRDLPRAAGFADLVKGVGAKAYIRALVIDPSMPRGEQAAAWRAALPSADTMEQQRRALYQLAVLGELQVSDLAVGRASRAISAAQAEVLSARNDAAQSRVDQAVMSLRKHAESNSSAAEMLVEVLTGANRIDEALAECDHAIGRFGAGKIAVDKLNILARAGRMDEADAFALRLLAGQDLATEQRVALRIRLIQNRAKQGHWTEVEQMNREALAESPDNDDFMWGLITAQANQGRLEQAWSSYQAMKTAVTRPEFVPLWMRLHARFGFSLNDVGIALDFVNHWPDNRNMAADIFSVIADARGQLLPDGRPVVPDLDNDTLERLEAELQNYILRYPDGPLTMIEFKNVDLVQVIRAQLISNSSSLDAAARKVCAGELPIGALAIMAQRPYTTMLIEQSCGALYAVPPDSEKFQREVLVAKEAVNGEVVIETSVLALILAIPERWPVLRSAFAAVRLPRLALADIDAARRDLMRAPGFSFAISYDKERQTLIRREVSLAEHQKSSRRVTEFDQAARQLTITDLEPKPGPSDQHQAWLSSIDLAAERKLPLWSDDVAVRSIAVSQGTATFGTYPLLTALIQTDLIPDTRSEDTMVLADDGVIELLRN